MKQTDLGIFLHRTPFSESSAIVSYFTKDHGFRKFVFLGAKKKNAQLFPLNVQELDFYQRNDSDLGKLTGAKNALRDLEIPFHPIRSCLAFFIAEIIGKCVNHTEKDEQLFSFLVHQIQDLNDASDLKLFPHKFLIGFAEQLGFAPQVDHDRPTSFQLDDGVFTAGHQMQNAIQGKPMELILSLVNEAEIDNTSISERREAMDALILYFRLHIEHFGQLKSKAILDTLFQA